MDLITNLISACIVSVATADALQWQPVDPTSRPGLLGFESHHPAQVHISNRTFPIDLPLLDISSTIFQQKKRDLPYSSKSRYPHDRILVTTNSNTSHPENHTSQCKTVQIQMVLRHGTRSPSSGKMNIILLFYLYL